VLVKDFVFFRALRIRGRHGVKLWSELSRFGISLYRSDAYGGDQASADPGALRAMLVAALEERTIENIGDNLAPERTCESISRGDQSFQRSTASDHHVHDLAEGESDALEEGSDHMARPVP
jgi:hypothetical protein